MPAGSPSVYFWGLVEFYLSVSTRRLQNRLQCVAGAATPTFNLLKALSRGASKSKGRTNDECRQLTRLTDHFALIADAALAFVCESLHAGENRIGVEMRFRDHFRFEAAGSPGIVEVGRE